MTKADQMALKVAQKQIDRLVKYAPKKKAKSVSKAKPKGK